jgi:hypothetical protein
MDKKVQVIFPKLKSFGAFGVGCMHSKLQLLFHTDYLRVVVPTVEASYTANPGKPCRLRLGRDRYNGECISLDILTQSMYIQDFPRNHSLQNAESMPQFAKELLFYIKAQNLPPHILSKVCEYDFSKSAGVEFVHSMSGEHLAGLDRHGKNGLASAIKRLGFEPSQSQTLQLCYVVKLKPSGVYLTPAMNEMLMLDFIARQSQ